MRNWHEFGASVSVGGLAGGIIGSCAVVAYYIKDPPSEWFCFGYVLVIAPLIVLGSIYMGALITSLAVRIWLDRQR
jgi:hypothetical protein